MSLPYSNATSKTAWPVATNLAVFAAGLVTFVNMYCTQSILPVLAAAFHVAPGAAALTVTAPLIATACMAPVIGAISDRFGRRRLVVGAALLLILPTALSSIAGSLDQLILWRFIQGIILPFIFTVTIAYIGEEADGPHATRLAATYMSGGILGGFAGRAIAGFGTQFFGWRTAMLMVATVTALGAVIISTCLRPERRFRPTRGLQQALRSFPAHLSNPPLLATYSVGFGVLFCMIAVFTFIDFRLAAAPYDLGPAALGAIFVVYLGGIVMSQASARLANRFGRPKVMLLATPMAIAGLGLTLTYRLPLVMLGLLLICSALFMQQTLATAFVSIAARHAKSAAVGLYVTFYYVGGSIGGFAPAWAYRAHGWPGCVALVACAEMAMTVVVVKYWK